MSIKVQWRVDDGFAGPDRPHASEFELDDFLHCDTEQEVIDQLNGFVQEEFEQRITWYMRDEKSVVAEIMRLKAEAP